MMSERGIGAGWFLSLVVVNSPREGARGLEVPAGTKGLVLGDHKEVIELTCLTCREKLQGTLGE